MCKRGKRSSRRVCNHRTRVWVNQYNSVENNYGTVMNLSKGAEECEDNYTAEEQPATAAVAVQFVNEQKNTQPKKEVPKTTNKKGNKENSYLLPITVSIIVLTGLIFLTSKD